ncbi:hypothetical protein EXIGLDRAFT_832415 [Exidia glandulosa HHB12029]|uniref:F-box domain-containing protein n=1 Tax=Exidia glandulosa HHB12029 TaxID=1314781 RepID=A0A165LPU0_EXIGL|nr:hypothetical protein EXIGLDRAFT_832415 [Exidia glandulosa HHB12029]
MTSLPYDVLCCVVARASTTCYHTLCISSRDFNAITTPLLYRDIWLDFPSQFLDTIINSPKLGQHVVSLKFNTAISSQSVASKLPPALRKMTHLRHLSPPLYHDLKNHARDILDALGELKELDSVRIERPDAYEDNPIFDALPPLKKIDIDSSKSPIPRLERLILRSIHTLEYLATEEYPLGVFLDRYGQGLAWPHMQSLRASCLPALSITRAFPALKLLHLSRQYPEPESMLWDETFFPSLDTLILSTISASLSTRPTSQRKLAHLHLSTLGIRRATTDAVPIAEFTKIMRCVDLSSLRSLNVHSSNPSDHKAIMIYLHTIFDHCSSLCFLRLVSWGSDPTSDPKAAIRNLLTWMSKLQQLKFVHVELKDIYRRRDDEGYLDYVAESVPEVFSVHANLRVVELKMPEDAKAEFWQWTRRRTAAPAGSIDEPIIFRTLFGNYTEDQLPWDASTIAQLVDHAA